MEHLHQDLYTSILLLLSFDSLAKLIQTCKTLHKRTCNPDYIDILLNASYSVSQAAKRMRGPHCGLSYIRLLEIAIKKQTAKPSQAYHPGKQRVLLIMRKEELTLQIGHGYSVNERGLYINSDTPHLRGNCCTVPMGACRVPRMYFGNTILTVFYRLQGSESIIRMDVNVMREIKKLLFPKGSSSHGRLLRLCKENSNKLLLRNRKQQHIPVALILN